MMSLARATKLVPGAPAQATGLSVPISPIEFSIRYLVPAAGLNILLPTVTLRGSIMASTASKVLAGNVAPNGVNNNCVSSVGLNATVPAISCGPSG